MHKIIPVAFEWKMQDDAYNTVVVILDLSFEPLPAFQQQRLQRFHHRRSLIPHVRRSGVFHLGLLLYFAFLDGLQPIEPQLLAHVKLDQYKDRPIQNRGHR